MKRAGILAEKLLVIDPSWWAISAPYRSFCCSKK
jgi:hypothetical protein